MQKNNEFTFEIPLFPWAEKGESNSEDDIIELVPTDALAAYVAKEFSEAKLEQYSDLKYLRKLEAVAQDNRVLVTAICNKAASKKMQREIIEEVDGQCSDGFGEGFEQQALTEDFGYQYPVIYCSTWKQGWRQDAA